MKFNCGLTRDEKHTLEWNERLRRENWHDWFAWYPVQVASCDCRWLEVVQRKLTYCSYYEYSWTKAEYRIKKES